MAIKNRAEFGMADRKRLTGSPSSSYPLSGIESYSRFTGKVNIAVPIRHIGGRGSAGYDMSVRIADQWIATKLATGDPQNPFNTVASLTPWQSWSIGYGPGTMFGRSSQETVNYCQNGSSTPQYTLSRLTFAGADGSETELRDTNTDGKPYTVPNYCTTTATSWDGGRGSVFASKDGSGMVFHSDNAVLDYFSASSGPVFQVSGYLHLADGTTYRISNSSVSWIRDRNGNTITFAYNGTHQITQILDQNGRSTTVTYGSTTCQGSPQTSCDLITYTGWQGPQTIEIGIDNVESNLRNGYSPANLYELFPELSSGPHDPVLNQPNYSYVRLPDNHSFQFLYNNYGEIARVVLPTGGAFEYDWNGVYVGGDGFNGQATQDGAPVMIDRVVVTRRVYPDGSTLSGTTSYNYQPTQGTGGTPAQNTTETVVDQNQNQLSKTVHTFWGNAFDALLFTGIGYNNWQEGNESTTQYGSPDKTENRSWTSTPVSWCNASGGGPFTCSISTGEGYPAADSPRFRSANLL